MNLRYDLIGRVAKEFKEVPRGFKNKYRVQPPAELLLVRDGLSLLRKREDNNKIVIEEKQSGKVFDMTVDRYNELVDNGYIKEK